VLRVRSDAGATLNVSAGPVSRQVAVPASADWTVVEIPGKWKVTGMQDVSAELVSGTAEVDWVSFR